MKDLFSSEWLFGKATLKEAILLACSHLVVFAALVVALRMAGFASWGPDALLNFDAAHYHEIATAGYHGFLQAFFPLFPMAWKVLGCGPAGIAILNALIYLSSLIWLSRLIRPSRAVFMVWLILPSALFYFVPYTESFFFACSVVLIVGLVRRLTWLTCLGLLLCGAARPAFTVLVPALCILSVFRNGFSASACKEVMLWLTTASVSIGIVAIVQHHYTREWFGFVSAQTGWNNSLRLPELPLTSWGGAASVRLDAVALLFGAVSVAWLALLVVTRRFPNASPAHVVSLGYIACITASVLAFRGGELFSLNRFVFATPFALVMLSSASSMKEFGAKLPAWLLFLSLSAFFLLMGSYVHIQTFLAYGAIALYITWIASVRRLPTNVQTIGFWLWILTTLGLQLFFLNRFLLGGWVA